MISVIIATYNRVQEIEKTLPSYLEQLKAGLITEIIVINDKYEDKNKLENLLGSYPLVKIINNKKRQGAFRNKKKGALLAKNKYIFFGEDDAYLGPDYIEQLYDFVIQNQTFDLGVVSGSIVYMRPGEDYFTIDSKERLNQDHYFDYSLLKFNPYGRLPEKVNKLPFTHALFLVEKDLFINHLSDNSFLSKGNGYREETEIQLKLWLAGFENIILNSVSCFHLNKKDVKKGGQNQSNRFKKFFWTCTLNFYFLHKYFKPYKEKSNVQGNFYTNYLKFICQEFNILFIRPVFRKIGLVEN